MTKEQLELDVIFLAGRAADAGSWSSDEHRDHGMSSNSLVGLAYGIGRQYMPSDWSDYAACLRAVRKLPRHRLTHRVRMALSKAWVAVDKKYPVVGRRGYYHRKKAA